MKVAFDIGGVISRYPERMKEMMSALMRAGVEVYVITDMSPENAREVCRNNDVPIHPDSIYSADWSGHGDRCKTEVCKRLGIDVLIDDRPDYCAEGDFIGLVLSPRPHVPYYAAEWNNTGLPTVCVPPDEYAAFKEWHTQRHTQVTENR